MTMADILPVIWAGIIAFGVAMYVLLDGFDLGMGMLFRSAQGEDERDIMMNSVAPIWDGNETWLVLGGAGLLAAFPAAYSTILPALYLPLLIMLLALIFRGVAFEFRFKAERSKGIWNWSFFLGSTVATFAQGVVLGAYVLGTTVEENQFVGGLFDWFSPFVLVTGLGLMSGYILLGATWLVMKTEGALEARARRQARMALVAVVGFMAVVSLWMPLQDADIADRWFSWPNIALLSPVPLVVAGLALWLWHSLGRGATYRPFLLAIALFLMGFAGLAISLWPHVVPPDLTIWEASSPPESQGFLLVGMAFLVPTILIYTAYTYYIFRGKVRADAGYH